MDFCNFQGARFISLEKRITINVHEFVAILGRFITHGTIYTLELDSPQEESTRQEATGRQFASRGGQNQKAPRTLFHCGELWEEWITRNI